MKLKSKLDGLIQTQPGKLGSKPLVVGTRFSLAQLFAELSEGRSITDIADDFDLSLETLKNILQAFSTLNYEILEET